MHKLHVRNQIAKARQIRQSAEIAKAAVEQAQTTNEQVESLSNAANKIGEVFSLINDIASQANLSGAKRHDRGGTCR